MDIGEGLLNKLEDYFGRTVAKAVVALVVFSICVYAVKIIYTEVAKPLVSWLAGLGLLEQSWSDLIALLLTFLSVMMTIVTYLEGAKKQKSKMEELQSYRARFANGAKYPMKNPHTGAELAHEITLNNLTSDAARLATQGAAVWSETHDSNGSVSVTGWFEREADAKSWKSEFDAQGATVSPAKAKPSKAAPPESK